MAGNRFGPGTNADDPSGDVPRPTVRAVLRAVADGEVLFVAFPRLNHALVVDARRPEPDDPAPPCAVVASDAGGPAAMLGRLYPGRPPSGRAIAATWGGSMRAFAEQGVLAAIIAKLPPEAESCVLVAYARLQAAERAPAPPEAASRPTGGTRYQPIADHLATVAGGDAVLPFAEIERLIDGFLPVSAYSAASFWTDPKSALVHALSRRGWRARLDGRNRRVRFTRDGA